MAKTVNAAIKSAIFLTFSGNCKKALTFYQGCFGGEIHLETFQKQLMFRKTDLIVCGSLISGTINIHGSDLVHDEGRKSGNHISIYLFCKNVIERKELMNKLGSGKNYEAGIKNAEQKLVEITDVFDVRWMLGI